MAGIRRSQYYNMSPAQQESAKAEFARRLQRMMSEAGLNQTELARLATKHMPVDKRTGKPKELSRDNVSNYVRGLVLPRPDNLRALCSALDCQPNELIPPRGVPTAADNNAPPLEFRAIDGGRVWLRINQTVTYETAMKIVALLNSEGSSPLGNSAKS